jgi:hypothetical protein
MAYEPIAKKKRAVIFLEKENKSLFSSKKKIKHKGHLKVIQLVLLSK